MRGSINSRMKLIRESLNLDQKAMADSIGLKQGSYSSIENTAKGISGSVGKLLEILYNVNIEFLYKGIGKPFIDPSIIEKRYGFTRIGRLPQVAEPNAAYSPKKDEIELTMLREMVDVLRESNIMYKNQVEDLKKQLAIKCVKK